MPEQELIEVRCGLFHTIVPKSSERDVRRIFYGKPEEKRLIIRPYPDKMKKEDLKEIVFKLNKQ